MTLRDVNTRYAALKLIADLVDQAMKEEKAAHLEALQESAEESGAKSWTVSIDGEKVASVTLSQRAGGVKIMDEAALVDWLKEHRPDMLETKVSVKPWAAKELLASVVDVTDEGAVTEDGEVLPGVEETSPGAPYQSLRWDKTNQGRERVADAIRAGDLADVLEGTNLPLLGGSS